MHSGSYFIEASFLSGSRGSLCPCAVNFCPENLFFDYGCAALTRYSGNTYMIEFMPEAVSRGGVFEPVGQIKYKQGNVTHTATLFYDDFYYIELENEESIIKKRLGREITDAVLSAENINGNIAAAVYGKYGDDKYCLFLGYGDDYKILGEFFCRDCKIENNQLAVEKIYRDMRMHCEKAYYDYDGVSFKEVKREKSALKPVPQNKKLLPYYFAEAVFSDNFDEAVTMLDKESYGAITPIQLKNFFGEFTEVTQNVYDEKYAPHLALRKKSAKSFYELKYYKFSLKDGLIDNITEVE